MVLENKSTWNLKSPQESTLKGDGYVCDAPYNHKQNTWYFHIIFWSSVSWFSRLSPPPSICRMGVRALQPAPFHSSAGLRHVAFAGDQVWASRKHTEKKIRKLVLMKTRSTDSLSLFFSLSLFLPLAPVPLFTMNLERRERRRIKVNSEQLSAAADDRALKCKRACVCFSLSSFFLFWVFFFSFFMNEEGKPSTSAV